MFFGLALDENGQDEYRWIGRLVAVGIGHHELGLHLYVYAQLCNHEFQDTSIGTRFYTVLAESVSVPVRKYRDEHYHTDR